MKTNFEVKFSAPIIKRDLLGTWEMHGTCYSPIRQNFALCSVLVESREKLVNRMTHTNGRQLPIGICHSFNATKLNKEGNVKNG